jgi:hypothetical protein
VHFTRRLAINLAAVMALFIGGGVALAASLSGNTLSLNPGDSVTASCPNALTITGQSADAAVLKCAPNVATGSVASVQSNAADGGLGTSFTVSATSGVTAGDLLVVTDSFGNNVAVTPPSGWTQAGPTEDIAGNAQAQIFYTEVTPTTAGQTSWMFALASTHSISWTFREWSSPSGWASSPVDATSGATGDSSTVGAGSPGSTEQASELWVADFAYASGPVGETLASGWTSGGEAYDASNNTGREAYKIASTTGAPSATLNLASALDWAGVVATFKTGSTGSPPTTTTTLPTTTTVPTTTTTTVPTTTTTTTTSGNCSDPTVVPMDPSNAQAGVSSGNYYVTNDSWNASGYTGSQTLYICSAQDWWVVDNWNNSTGDGAVKVSPNVQENFGTCCAKSGEPTLSSLGTITSTFQVTNPAPNGIWEDEYDIWLNGIASSGSNEVMIWTDNNGQTPAGSVVGTTTIGGVAYTVWATSDNSYVAFVANTGFTSGTLNLSAFFSYLQAQGRLSSSSVLGQVDEGIEMVSTNSSNQTFTFNNFSITTTG